MAYSSNILPRSAAYYELNNAEIRDGMLDLGASGYAEIQISTQMLSTLTEKMLVVVHPSIFSNSYVNDAVQVNLSILTTDGEYIEQLISVVYDKSGVFNTEITLPEVEYSLFTYRISSKIPVTIYNWELCAEEASDMTTVIEGIEQELPRLLYDYNTYSYAIEQKELTVGLIACYLLDSTDLQGHFTLSFFATERCNVHVRIKDNGITELFSPQVYTVERGYASISIPHAYLKKKATDHNFSVTVQCTNGQLSIPVRGLLYTIDGGYLVTRLLDPGIDIEDISIRQISTDTEPSEIWAVGFEGNRIVLSKRVYSQQMRVNWTAVKDFGEGLAAAVEFRGQWNHRTSWEKNTLDTEETPYVFILGVDNTLRCYSGSNYGTTIDLDTEVSVIAACQGFNSMYDIEQDQGLIIAYVKNGNVYYRQYLHNEDTETYMWHAVEPLYEDGDATFVGVHRLPDYRVGICVEYSGGIKWYITDRMYVSQTVKPEIYSPSNTGSVIATVIDANKALDALEWEATLNEFEEARLYETPIYTMTFDGSVSFIAGKTVNDLARSIIVTLNGNRLSSDAIEKVEIKYNAISVQLATSVGPGDVITINLNFFYVVIKIYNGCFASIKKEYSWTMPTPTTLLKHFEENTFKIKGWANMLELDVIQLETTSLELYPEEFSTALSSTELDLTVRQLITTGIDVSKETFSSSVGETDLDLTVTLVGTVPV